MLWRGKANYRSKQPEGKMQKTVMPKRRGESGHQIGCVCNMPWKLM